MKLLSSNKRWFDSQGHSRPWYRIVLLKLCPWAEPYHFCKWRAYGDFMLCPSSQNSPLRSPFPFMNRLTILNEVTMLWTNKNWAFRRYFREISDRQAINLYDALPSFHAFLHYVQNICRELCLLLAICHTHFVNDLLKTVSKIFCLS